MINIYVGNLPYKTSEADLAELFGAFGKVERASIVMDRQTGRSRGFGFVEMVDHAEGTKAIEALAGNEWNGRPLTINEARPRGSGTTGGNGGFSSSTTSFGESAGYSNTVAPAASPKPTEPAAKPEADAELAQAEAPAASEAPSSGGDDDPPTSSGYSNSMVG
ncbi:MAG: RNA-binding protein [Planctomycetota bacterium]